MTLKARRFLVMTAFVLSCCGYPAAFMQVSARVNSFSARMAEVNGEAHTAAQKPVSSTSPSRVIWLVLFICSAVGWLVAIVGAGIFRPLRTNATLIGWPILLLVFGYFAAPFYIWQHIWHQPPEKHAAIK